MCRCPMLRFTCGSKCPVATIRLLRKLWREAAAIQALPGRSSGRDTPEGNAGRKAHVRIALVAGVAECVAGG